MLTVKSQDIQSLIEKAQPFLTGVPMVTMQNGVQSDDLVASLLRKENVVSSVVVFSAYFLQPGKVSYSIPFSATALLMGEPLGANGTRLHSLIKLFNGALPTEMSEDIRGAHWTKLLWNLNTAVPAMTGLTYQEGAQHYQIRRLYIGLMTEGPDAVKAAGIRPAVVPGFPLDPIEKMARMPLPVASRLARSFFGGLPIHGSMYQSIKRGQKTEIDYMNGEVVSLCNKEGVPTPANLLTVGLVHEVEATGKFLTVPELTRELGRNP